MVEKQQHVVNHKRRRPGSIEPVQAEDLEDEGRKGGRKEKDAERKIKRTKRRKLGREAKMIDIMSEAAKAAEREDGERKQTVDGKVEGRGRRG